MLEMILNKGLFTRL